LVFCPEFLTVNIFSSERSWNELTQDTLVLLYDLHLVFLFLFLVGGWFASLAVAGYTALVVRKVVKTQLIPAEPMSKPSPFSAFEIWAWAAIFVASFGVAYFNPTVLGTTARTSLPFLLAATVLGYMVGSG
jgi:hypothetical protein